MGSSPAGRTIKHSAEVAMKIIFALLILVTISAPLYIAYLFLFAPVGTFTIEVILLIYILLTCQLGLWSIWMVYHTVRLVKDLNTITCEYVTKTMECFIDHNKGKDL